MDCDSGVIEMKEEGKEQEDQPGRLLQKGDQKEIQEAQNQTSEKRAQLSLLRDLQPFFKS